MSELDRTKECDCWAKLNFCPVNCDESELDTPKQARGFNVIGEEIVEP